MTPTEHVASTIVSIATHYPHLVTDRMHAGIDLARALHTGDLAVADDPQHVLRIAETEALLQVQLMAHFS